jgi:hypothetical protein
MLFFWMEARPRLYAPELRNDPPANSGHGPIIIRGGLDPALQAFDMRHQMSRRPHFDWHTAVSQPELLRGTQSEGDVPITSNSLARDKPR